MRASVLTFATLLALTLTACGGGGGSSDNPNQSPVAVNTPTNGGDNNTGTGTNTPKPNNGNGSNTGSNTSNNGINENYFKAAGKAIKFVDGKQISTMDSKVIDGNKITLTNSDKDVMKSYIKVDGKDFQLMMNENYAYHAGGKYPHISASFSYARFGIMNDKYSLTDYLFYTGKEHLTPVKDMPTMGTAKYSGHAVGYRPSDQEAFMSHTPVIFDVDFKNKTINGTIYELNNIGGLSRNISTPHVLPKHNTVSLKDIKLFAKINGNTFSGTANGVSTEGIFVGPKAAEMTGLFKDNNNKIQGAFGAKKQ